MSRNERLRILDILDANDRTDGGQNRDFSGLFLHLCEAAMT